MIYKLSLTLLMLWLIMVVASLFVGDSANAVNLQSLLQPPSSAHLFGTDELGRPLLERVLLGAQTSMMVALSVVIFSALIGTTVGIVSAYYGGWIDRVLTKVIDVFLAFPGLLLAIALAAVLGPGIENVVFALVVVGWVGYARLARAQTLSLRSREHILAAKALAVPDHQIFYRHLLPLIMAPLGVEATFGIAGAVLAEAGLSFLGLGVQPPDASWGNMIKEGTRYLLVAPHLVLAPGIALMLLVLAVNLLGDQFRDYLDIRGRQQKNL
ncbi:peptide ABC transporter permease [Thiosulfatimonas sediminis]|uniref:Peptide ABC transporter permease n=1 Tax=Thiosulfatimonas sediminis TaxID=2675054 RepID=A0A6F8PUN6_9GAMM|nr:ABC transporter permease [Thiosulfatimonas sediminis]BBP45835.1 peptide ABC transporter permease [Thiosulfatimonas sediminis]